VSEGTPEAVYVAESEEIPDGEARRIQSPDLPEPVAVFNSGGGFYALGDTCSHGAASLSEGWVEDCKVACPLHFSEFDLTTGKPCSLPAMAPVRAYTVEQRGQSLYLIPGLSTDPVGDEAMPTPDIQGH
jgi:3-phenylpropionate/trans-cinnamate dioxygenase ferredoxin subunit